MLVPICGRLLSGGSGTLDLYYPDKMTIAYADIVTDSGGYFTAFVQAGVYYIYVHGPGWASDPCPLWVYLGRPFFIVTCSHNPDAKTVCLYPPYELDAANVRESDVQRALDSDDEYIFSICRTSYGSKQRPENPTTRVLVVLRPVDKPCVAIGGVDPYTPASPPPEESSTA